MKRGKKILLIFLGLSLLSVVSEISYSIYLNRHWFNPVSYRLQLFIIGFIPALFLIIVVFKYTKNIQYRAYAILLLVVPTTNILEYIYFYFNGKGDTYILVDAIVFGALLFFAFTSTKLYIKYKHKSTLVIALSVIIVRYVLYSAPMRMYIHSNINISLFYSYLYFITALNLATSGYVIFNASKRSESIF